MLDFIRQFYDRRVGWVMLGLAITHLLAAVLQDSSWSWIPMIVIGAVAIGLSYHKLEWGLSLAFLELFVGGHGHLFDVDLLGFSLSIREVLFAAVMSVWLVQICRRQLTLKRIPHRDWPFALIGVSIILASIKGFISNQPAAVFDDMNGYLTLLYFLPIISLPWTNEQKRLFLQSLFVGALWVAVTTLAYLFAFTHLPGLASHELYTFVRDTRLAEITLQTSGQIVNLLGASPWYFRVFQQSQASVLVFELLLLAGTFMLWRERNEPLPRLIAVLHVLMLATLVASLSRSFWLGGVAGFVTALIYVALTRPALATLCKRHVQLGLSACLAVLALFVIIVFPLPARPDLSDSSFYRNGDGDTRVVAVSSRWNLLHPMLAEIWQNPIFGSGFGETVTYISDDPRLRAITPNGEVTTYRFEWGYHDFWLKLGLPGLLGFGWLFVTVIAVAYEAVRRGDQNVWMAVGLTSGLVALYVTHIFSPYLNHPIGLGFILFTLPFLSWDRITTIHAEELTTPSPVTLALIKPVAGVLFKE